MSSFIINGKRFNMNGSVRNVSVSNGRVIINGEDVDISEFKEKNIQISIEGNVDTVKVDMGDVTVKGSAGTISTVSGDVDIDGNVTGSVSSVSGDIKVGGNIAGSAKTVSGDIKYRK